MNYFKYLPQVQYPDLTRTDGTGGVSLTNLLTRSAFLKEIVENSSLYYEYQVKDGETAEIIADKLYNDPHRAWIVLLFNNLMNPYYDFPLVSEQLHDYIEAKYDQTIEQAQSTIHHYEERITYTVYYMDVIQSQYEKRFTISQTYQNPNTGVVETRPSLPVTADTSIVGPSYTEDFGSGVTVNVSTVYHAISNYTYELEANEARRTIRLLDKSYVIPVENEFKRLMRDG